MWSGVACSTHMPTHTQFAREPCHGFEFFSTRQPAEKADTPAGGRGCRGRDLRGRGHGTVAAGSGPRELHRTCRADVVVRPWDQPFRRPVRAEPGRTEDHRRHLPAIPGRVTSEATRPVLVPSG